MRSEDKIANVLPFADCMETTFFLDSRLASAAAGEVQHHAVPNARSLRDSRFHICIRIHTLMPRVRREPGHSAPTGGESMHGAGSASADLLKRSPMCSRHNR